MTNDWEQREFKYQLFKAQKGLKLILISKSVLKLRERSRY
jgi:hypothetical protein